MLLGASMSFRQVRPVVRLLGRVHISASTICRLTERAGAGLVAVEEAMVSEIERTMPDAPVGAACQQVSVDGAMVPLRGGEWREAKTAAIGELAITQPGKTQSLSYVSRLQDHERFARVATAELHRRGTFVADQVVAVVDGALWCQGFYDYHLPNAVRVLDFPHAVEHLNQAGQVCFGPGSAQLSEWLGPQRHALKHGDPQTVVDAIARLPVESAADPHQAAKIRDQVHGYLQPRVAQMAYANFTAQGFPIGSGIVESANKLVVEDRLKGAGMHWKEEHVDPILALRCAICSHRWEELWPAISKQRRHAARRSVSRPPMPLPDPIPEPEPTTPASLLPSPVPKLPMFVNGKPTLNHPWKQTYQSSSQESVASIPKT